jgi:hypothetical protein
VRNGSFYYVTAMMMPPLRMVSALRKPGLASLMTVTAVEGATPALLSRVKVIVHFENSDAPADVVQ